ncbi:prolyl oligopeptidase family serine peptidase [uncultured Eudoraea sp.]|uniref:alpha/beta hydrolase family protein n=1 Tax=uncultured Eudoraea sp. TaxID=1035614 RepID=UPI0026172805|nr:prolyl oligopeptidase family serine peptidase [uncultured Eudoraea sp.]
MKLIISSLLAISCFVVFAQKKVLDHKDFAIWNSIKNKSISPNGNYILYSLEKGERDHYLKVHDKKANMVFEYDRGSEGKFTYDSNYAIFTIKAWKDSVIAMKRRKVKKKDLPKDSLGIYDLANNSLLKIGHIRSYKIPEKWNGYLAYQIEEIKEEKSEIPEDTLGIKEKDDKEKKKKVGKKNGYHLLVQDIRTGQKDTFKFVTDYTFAKKGKQLAFATTGSKQEENAGVYILDFDQATLAKVHSVKKGKYYQLNFSESGDNLGFIVDPDTTKVQIRPTELFLWQKGQDRAIKVAEASNTPLAYHPSQNAELLFSKDESKLFFGLTKPPIIKDTLITEDEIVNVEVWTYDEPRLYTVQELQLKTDTIQSFQAVLNIKDDFSIVQLGSTDYPEVELGNEGNSAYSLLKRSEPYQLEQQWTGRRAKDYAILNSATGKIKEILTKVTGPVNLSPGGKFVYGYNSMEETWFAYNIEKDSYLNLTKDKEFYDELHDSPSPPDPYGAAGWIENDKAILLYDRYDIWRFDPFTGEGKRFTKGRETKTRFRYVSLDKEERFLDTTKKWLLTAFNETDKSGGYAEFNPKDTSLKFLLQGPFRFRDPIKAELDDAVIFTRESFEEFPDIRYADLRFKNIRLISNANPQQNSYNWGTIELVNWTSLNGDELTGLLVKPENFDPSKKYPMIVNFYEKSSDRLHYHRAPNPGRSTINYSFYASRGYLIFNPDVNYRIGYPGESAYNCVIPGVTSLIEKGFVDKDNIGVQGHSWGGYQIAYLVTKTDIFKAAEAGAPVPNMISAYGGIRWWTGLSRQFQYEHTQSRIGGTPWEYPIRYMENSPIFNIDKINTPLLIMHNDADGHVPWYQGIEFFVSLRRLGKPSWFLNYNGEPHWPLKLQNRKDFNIRMAQFFDHYLKGAPLPKWMDRGVPAIEKGVNQGYELIENSDGN